jgi:hypothetical protein
MSWLLRKSVLGLVVGLSLVTPLASAAQRPREGRMAAAKFSLPTPSEMFVGAWSFLVRIRRGGLTLRTKNGCKLDPNGACLQEPGTGSSIDAVCGIDPHGACAGSGATSSSDNGCGLDPHGACTGGR